MTEFEKKTGMKVERHQHQLSALLQELQQDLLFQQEHAKNSNYLFYRKAVGINRQLFDKRKGAN